MNYCLLLDRCRSTTKTWDSPHKMTQGPPCPPHLSPPPPPLPLPPRQLLRTHPPSVVLPPPPPQPPPPPPPPPPPAWYNGVLSLLFVRSATVGPAVLRESRGLGGRGGGGVGVGYWWLLAVYMALWCGHHSVPVSQVSDFFYIFFFPRVVDPFFFLLRQSGRKMNAHCCYYLVANPWKIMWSYNLYFFVFCFCFLEHSSTLCSLLLPGT